MDATINNIILEYQGVKTILELNNLTNIIEEVVYRYSLLEVEKHKAVIRVQTDLAEEYIKQIADLKTENERLSNRLAINGL